jgi:hypothetical protein
MFASRLLRAASHEQAADPHLPGRSCSVALCSVPCVPVQGCVREVGRLQMLEAGGGPNRGGREGEIKPFQGNELEEEGAMVLVLAFSRKGTAVMVAVAVKFKPVRWLRE